VSQARKDFASAASKLLLDFIASAKRGVCRDFGNAQGEEPGSEA
jgi:hypothetical protein